MTVTVIVPILDHQRCEFPPPQAYSGRTGRATMSKQVRIIGVPMDYGADRRGVDMGPSAIRYAGLTDHLSVTDIVCVDRGDLSVPHVEKRDPDANPPTRGRAKFLREVGEICDQLGDDISRIVAKGHVPLVLGGDHSIAIGTINGSARNADIGVIWFDAHGDFNTPTTTPSGNVHGMALAAPLGLPPFDTYPWAVADGLTAKNVVLIGTRDLDDEERSALLDSDVTVLTMSDIDSAGVNAIVEQAIDIAAAGTDGIHISLDLDWLDPKEAPGVGTPVRGGVTYREAHAAMETLATWDRESAGIRSIDLVEVNPILDRHNATAELAVELVASALGRRIL